jgi:plastocyanin
VKRPGKIGRIFPGRRAHALLLGAAAILAVAGWAGCGHREEPEEASEARPQAPAPVNPNAQPVDPATAGTISGIVKLEGTPPRMRAINMRSVPSCDKMHTTPPTLEEVVPGENGTLQNVVVYLQGDFRPYSFPPATEPVKIDQQGCLYVPHVVAVTARTPVQVHNSDSVTHNSFAITKNNSAWNETQSVGGPPVERVFAVPEISLALKCNVHPWMKAYVAVFDHPYFQVTGQDGSFSLKNVPPGTYTLTAWQERYGTIKQQVTLAPQGEQNVTLSFQAGG